MTGPQCLLSSPSFRTCKLAQVIVNLNGPGMPARTGSNANQETHHLAEDTVHVWWANLHASSVNAADAFNLLDSEERARAARFRSDVDRAQFVASRSMLRSLLSLYLGCEPSGVRFGHAPGGKPHLLRNDAWPDLRFNASRTRNLAMFAIAAGREVGVDTEQITFDGGIADAIGKALTDDERASLAALSSQTEKHGEFFKFWVRKEAFLKACGQGLAIAPARVHARTPSGKVYLRGRLQRGWRVYDVAVGAGYSAAVAAEGERWRVVLHAFDSHRTSALGACNLK